MNAKRLTFGELLREFRRRLNISQEELDERARVAKDTISALERGKRKYPTAATVARLAAALRLDPDDLLRFEAAAKRPRLARRRNESPAIHKPTDPALTNLPIELESIIAREPVVDQLRSTLAAYRCVTLVGTGGVGKTRIARQVGASLLSAYDDGVWFVELASVADPALIVEHIAGAVGMATPARVPALEMLKSFLRDRRMLLIIDNCEHLIAETAAITESLLQGCEYVQILSTSRERLGVRGERLFRVPPLSLPPSAEDATLDEIAMSGAVQLFVERAQAADPNFELSSETAGIVANICRRLDGIPFAIELAASRVDSLRVADIEQLVESRFNRLVGRYRSAPPRHRTMHALIDWSFELLSLDQQLLLSRLACFTGHWTADAAGVVCRFGPLESANILELITSLVEKSFVVMENGFARARYRLLESTRQFALSKLDGSEKHAVENRVAHWVAEFSDLSYESLYITPRAEWLPSMLDEIDNARASLALSLDADTDVSIAARIIAAYRSFWFEEGLLSEGFRWTERALARIDGVAHPISEASLWHSLSWLLSGAPCVAAAQEAIARHQRLGDTEELAGAHVRLTLGYYQIAQFEDALAASERALSLFNDAGRNRSLHYGAALSCRALALIGLGRHAEAREGFTACIALIEALGDGERAAGARINLAELDFAQGDVASAIANIDTALLVVRGRVPAAETAALLNAAAYRLVLGEIPAAHRAAADALRLTRRLGSAPLRTFSLQHLATVAALKGDVKRAAALLGYIDACLAREGLARGPTEARTFEILASSLEERLTADERNELAAAGRSLSDSEAIELALSIHAS